jgi:Holliday junction resolvase
MGAVIVIRSAGSKGLVDVVAWMENGETWFVQCKLTGKISKADRNDLRDVAAIVGAVPIIAHKPGRGQIVLERIDGVQDDA